MKLLTSNTKLEKCEKFGYLALGLQLAPGQLAGFEVCPARGACYKTCLFYAGRGLMASQARIERTRLWRLYPNDFIAKLGREIQNAGARAFTAGLKLAVRLNCFSDIAWEDYFPMECYPFVQFYDYTKRYERIGRFMNGPRWPRNYHLVWSHSEKAPHGPQWFLDRNVSVALVTRHEGKNADLTLGARSCVDGDKHDLTFLHPPGSLILLSPKGPLEKKRTAFVP